MFRDFLSMLFPKTCMACGNSLYKGENVICTFCRFHLPKTNFHKQHDNPVIRHFWGKINVHAASSYFYFYKGEKVQQLIHRLKYKGEMEIGLQIGELFGIELRESEWFNSVDTIVPVPLHINRQRMRGYNQSELIADGIAKGLHAKINKQLVKRIKPTTSQTRKHRYERWENVKDVFVLKKEKVNGSRHILLVDDVITTGSTLGACAESILEIPNIKLSIATLAYAAR